MLKTALDQLAAEYGTPTADEIEALEQAECVQCDWKGLVDETYDVEGQMVCPACREPVEFINGDDPVEETTLTYWTVKPLHKKSIEEQEEYTKDGHTITRKTGWRWGEWTVATNDGNPPEFEFDSNGQIDMNSCYGNNIEEVEMVETNDGCWEDYDYSESVTDEEKEEIEAFIEENDFYQLEEEGWMHSETYMYVWGPIEITSQDGSITKVVND